MLEATTRTVPDRPWLLVALWATTGITLALTGALTRAPQIGPAFVVGSVALWSFAYARSPSLRHWLDVLPLRPLIALHAIRFPIGAVFLWEHSRGQLPELFAMRAGWGDIATGIAAIGVVMVGLRSRRVVMVFSALGLLDILVALGTGMYLLFVAQDPVMLSALTRLPYPLLPLLIVPAVILTHMLVLARKFSTTDRA